MNFFFFNLKNLLILKKLFNFIRKFSIVKEKIINQFDCPGFLSFESKI